MIIIAIAPVIVIDLDHGCGSAMEFDSRSYSLLDFPLFSSLLLVSLVLNSVEYVM